MRFRVGAIITAGKVIPDGYTVTNQNAVCVVIDTDYDHHHGLLDDIYVRVLEKPDKPEDVGKEFWVQSKYFIPYYQSQSACVGSVTALFE